MWHTEAMPGSGVLKARAVYTGTPHYYHGTLIPSRKKGTKLTVLSCPRSTQLFCRAGPGRRAEHRSALGLLGPPWGDMRPDLRCARKLAHTELPRGPMCHKEKPPHMESAVTP